MYMLEPTQLQMTSTHTIPRPPPSISTLKDVNDNTEAEQLSTSSTSNFPENQTGREFAPNTVTGSLKRKRPPTIEIPNGLREICADTKLAFRDLPRQDDSVCFSGSGVGVFSVKGKKKFMEDSHKIVSCSHSIKAFFGVYDGHGGRKAADFVAKNLHANIFKMLENCTGKAAREEAVTAGYIKTDEDFLKQGMAILAFLVLEVNCVILTK